jgi:hypothetical protein
MQQDELTARKWQRSQAQAKGPQLRRVASRPVCSMMGSWILQPEPLG